MPQPYVLTIHDMSTLLFPAHRRLSATRCMKQRYRRGALRAARVIAVSNSTRRDVETVLHVPRDASAPSTAPPTPPSPPTSTAAHDKPDPGTLLHPTRSFFTPAPSAPQKNIPRLIEAFAVLRGELENHPDYRELRLVIIGDELSKNPAVRRAVVPVALEPFVRFLGFVPMDTLRVFYRAAAVFAFPSLYEGFGLAPLEAMACGTPGGRLQSSFARRSRGRRRGTGQSR